MFLSNLKKKIVIDYNDIKQTRGATPANVTRRFQSTSSGRLKTKIQRSSVASAGFSKEGKVYIFGGRHWKRQGQPASDDFFQGTFQGNFFTWDYVDQRGCCPTPRFGHTFISCGQVSFVYGD